MRNTRLRLIFVAVSATVGTGLRRQTKSRYLPCGQMVQLVANSTVVDVIHILATLYIYSKDMTLVRCQYWQSQTVTHNLFGPLEQFLHCNHGLTQCTSSEGGFW